MRFSQQERILRAIWHANRAIGVFLSLQSEMVSNSRPQTVQLTEVTACDHCAIQFFRSILSRMIQGDNLIVCDFQLGKNAHVFFSPQSMCDPGPTGGYS